MKKAMLALTLLTVVSLACGSSVPSTKTVDDYMNEYGGNADVYNNILSLSDCALLQEQFNIASDNNQRETPGTSNHKATLGYMTAADDRMKALNCYGQSNLAPVASTQIIFSPTAYFTATIFFLPTLTKPVLPTAENTAVPTNTVIFILPTQAPSTGGSCDCSGDTLNCGDFSSPSSAQACMDYCISIGRGDIHNLDGNANGLACEDPS